MKSFVVLANHQSLERACMDLTAQLSFTKRHHALWLPSELLGMWVGPEPVIVPSQGSAPPFSSHSSPRLALEVQSSSGVSGRWMMFQVKDCTLTRVRLLDQLVASAGAAPEVDHQPRFYPVFPRSALHGALRSELSQLRACHARELRSPLLMNPITGAFEAMETAPGWCKFKNDAN